MGALRTRSTNSGFSLLELFVVLCVAGVLAAIAAPAYNSTVAKYRMRSAAGSLHLSMMKARSEATKRNGRVTVAAVNGDWSRGWNTTDFTNTVLESQGAPKAVVEANVSEVVYLSSGRVLGGTAPTFGITSGSYSPWCVQVDLSGRPYVKEAEC